MSDAIRKCLVNEWSHRGGATRRALVDSVSPGQGQRHALAAQGAWSAPVPYPGSPLHCTLHCSQPVSHCGLQVLPPPLPGVPCLSCFLNQGLTASQQGVGAPSLGMAPDKQLELLVAESVISKGKAETNNQSQETAADNQSHCCRGGGPLCSVLQPLHLEPPAYPSRPSATMSPLYKASPDCPSASLPLQTSTAHRTESISVITLSGNCSSAGVPSSLGAPESRRPAQSLGNVYGNPVMME